MLNEHIPLNNSKQNSHAMATDYNAKSEDRPWEQRHVEEAKASIPWRNPMFWAGVTSTVGISGIVLWTVWAGIAGLAKSDWVVKPAKDSEFHAEVRDLRESITRVEQRVEKVEQRVDGNAARTDAKLDHITDLLIRGAGPGTKAQADGR
jgi:hypothetical protein